MPLAFLCSQSALKFHVWVCFSKSGPGKDDQKISVTVLHFKRFYIGAGVIVQPGKALGLHWPTGFDSWHPYGPWGLSEVISKLKVCVQCVPLPPTPQKRGLKLEKNEDFISLDFLKPMNEGISAGKVLRNEFIVRTYTIGFFF